MFRGRGVTRAGLRVGPYGELVPSEGESPFSYMGALIPNVSSLIDILLFVQVFDNKEFF